MRPAAAVLAVAMACSAVANDVPGNHGDTASNDAPSFEEIIVTAERRGAPARTVPVSMTAVTAGQIAARQLRDVASLRHVAPSLESAPAQGNSETANIGMRGHVETDNAPSVDPAVGLFLDGVYLARATGANLRLFDVTRVEVIRGPQGTLFGRNTIGGAINIIPAAPSDRFEAALGLELGNFDARAFSGIFNTPLGNSAAVRIAARRSVRNGFASSIPLERDLGDDDTNYLRAALRYGQSGGATFDLSFDLTDIDTGSQWITALDAQPPATLVPAAAGQPQDSLDNYVDPYTNRTWASHAGSLSSLTRGTSASFSAPFGSATVRLTSAFRELVLDIRETDLDGTPYDVATQLRHQQWQSQASHELQVVGETAGARLDWVGGLYYFEEEADIDALSNNLVPIIPGETNSRGQVSNDSFSVFGQLRFRLPRDFRLTAGVRRTFDGRQLTSTNARLRNGVEICAIIPEILDDPGECRATLP
ncbi:MAG: TonB-dependent receptor, partial [Gammaproteobacteria bacterium]|nr:TonB-dependent receptor [Gammaproteobacteria bacterium]